MPIRTALTPARSSSSPRRWEPGRHPKSKPLLDQPVTTQPEWTLPREIRSPSELSEVMGIVSAAVRSGGLHQVANERSHLPTAADITRDPA